MTAPVQHAGSPQLSIVLPAFEEADNLEPLCQELTAVLSSLGTSYEIIIVDDGSTDDTFAVAERLHAADPHVKVVQLRRNYGQTAALAAGFHDARGEVVIAMDADGQYDPADIPRLLSKLDEGYDVVSGWRENRGDDPLSRRLPSRIANALMRRASGVDVRDFGATFKVYRREVLDDIRLYGDLHRFIPALAAIAGARIGETPVKLRRRRHGQSKYGLRRAGRVLLDIIAIKFLVSYWRRPLSAFGSIGLVGMGLGGAVMVYLSVLKVALHEPYMEHAPLLLLGILLFLSGLQMLSLGLLAELLLRTYHEAAGRPIYNVRRRLF